MLFEMNVRKKGVDRKEAENIHPRLVILYSSILTYNTIGFHIFSSVYTSTLYIRKNSKHKRIDNRGN